MKNHGLLQSEQDEQQLHAGKYSEMHTEVLKEILNHEIDHDCRCTDPESACTVCYRAWEEIQKRGISNNHFI